MGLSEAMRAELRDVPVEVSVVLPVVVNTELASGLGTVKGQPTIEPEVVAQAIGRTLERPRFEVWVPASAGRIFRVVSTFPRSVGESLGRVMGTTDILRKTDATARAGYLRRVLSRPPTSLPGPGDRADDRSRLARSPADDRARAGPRC